MSQTQVELILFGGVFLALPAGDPQMSRTKRLIKGLKTPFWLYLEHILLTMPWTTTEQDRSCYLFGVADRFEWIKRLSLQELPTQIRLKNNFARNSGNWKTLPRLE